MFAVAAVVAVLAAGPSADLRIVAWPAGPDKGGARDWRLHCDPARGSLPRPAAACTRLAALDRPFAPVPKDVGCTQIFGGRRVWATFKRTDGCEIARWNRHRFLFPILTGPR